MIRLAVGELQLTVLDAGRVLLDGGAMFGVVPKVLWERERPADARNRIPLAMNLLLVDDGKRRVLIDTGAGDKADEKRCEIYGLEPVSAAQLLAPAGLAPEQIDMVVNTHLHFDHAGGNTRRDGDGRLEPAFPNAEYVVQRGELELARWDNERIRAGFLAEDYEPLAEQGRLRLVEGATAVNDWLHLRVAPGHTPHMQIALIKTAERTLAFLADLCPTSSHVPYPWIMGFDLEPLVTLASKKRVLPQAAREGWWVLFEHDDRLPLGTLVEERGGLVVRPVEVEV